MNAEGGIGRSLQNPFERGGKPLVSKVTASNDIKKTLSKAVDTIGGFGKIIEKGDEILLKPNFNTSDPPPSSSDPDFVKAVIELLYEHGASRVVLGESSMLSASTRRIFEETGMLERATEAGAEVMFFDEGDWVKVRADGEYLRTVSLPAKALEDRKLVSVCCMKTHRWAKFTLSLKLSVGFMKPSERMMLHTRHIEEKVADLNLVVHPSMVIMDARRCFIAGGPACGELRTPNLVLASGDRVALDVEAIKVMRGYEGSSLTEDPWSYGQIRRSVALGLGAKNEKEYDVISD